METARHTYITRAALVALAILLCTAPAGAQVQTLRQQQRELAELQAKVYAMGETIQYQNFELSPEEHAVCVTETDCAPRWLFVRLTYRINQIYENN